MYLFILQFVLQFVSKRDKAKAKLISSFCALRNVTKLGNSFAVSILSHSLSSIWIISTLFGILAGGQWPPKWEAARHSRCSDKCCVIPICWPNLLPKRFSGTRLMQGYFIIIIIFCFCFLFLPFPFCTICFLPFVLCWLVLQIFTLNNWNSCLLQNIFHTHVSSFACCLIP